MSEDKLPNGFEVIYIYTYDKGDPVRMKESKAYAKKQGMEAKVVGDVLHIKGFIAGDTDELGISVLSFDNQKICLLAFRPEIHDLKLCREILRGGQFESGRKDIYRGGYSPSMLNVNPSCPYSK